MLHVSIPIEEDTDSPLWMAELTDITHSPADTTDQNIFDWYQQSHIRQDDGAYCVKFPWKQEHPPLPLYYNCVYKENSFLGSQTKPGPRPATTLW